MITLDGRSTTLDDSSHQSRLTGYAAAAPSTFRLRVGCSASVGMAPDGSRLLTLDASSVQTAPDGARRIVWMIIGMIKGEQRSETHAMRLVHHARAHEGTTMVDMLAAL